MTGKQGKKGSGTRSIRFAALLMVAAASFVLSASVSACDSDLIALVESETASSPSAAPWIRAAHAIASLSDALNGGVPGDDVVYEWNTRSMALFELEDFRSRPLRASLGSATWKMQSLIHTGRYTEAHEALQRQFALLLRGIAARQDMAPRPASLAELSGRVWGLAEAARDRDGKRFGDEAAGLVPAAERVKAAWAVSEDSPVEPVMHWAREIARAAPRGAGTWPDEILQAVSRLKESLVAFHGYLRRRTDRQSPVFENK